MTVATAHRFLLTLEHLGVVSRAGGNRFQLGTLLAELGDRVEHDKLMARIAQSHVDTLTARLGGAVAAAVLSGRKAIQMAMSHGPAAGAGEPPDPRLPVHCTAAGKVLLAGLRPAMLETILEDLELTAYTPHGNRRGRPAGGTGDGQGPRLGPGGRRVRRRHPRPRGAHPGRP